MGELIDYSSKLGLIEKSGAWYSHEGKKIGQGKENVKEYLKQHPHLVQSLEQQVLDKLIVQKNLTLSSTTETTREDVLVDELE